MISMLTTFYVFSFQLPLPRGALLPLAAPTHEEHSSL